MKKLAILLFAALTFAACDDNDSSSSSGAQSDYEVCMKTCMQYQGDYSYCRTDCADESTVVPGTTPGTSPGNDTAFLQELKTKGVLTASEEKFVRDLCSKNDGEEARCLAWELPYFSVCKAAGCYYVAYKLRDCTDSSCEEGYESQLKTCLRNGLTSYQSDIENSSIYKAFFADYSREQTCCPSWKPRYSYECENDHDQNEIYMTSLIYLFGGYSECKALLESFLQCSSKLSCNQSAESDDDAAYAICSEYEQSPYYQGDRYANYDDCNAKITHYCQSESDALERCFDSHYDF